MIRPSAKHVVFLMCQLAAFHPIWRWYATRLTDGSDEPWGLAALATGVILLWCNPGDKREPEASLLIPALLTVLYAAAFHFVPRLVQASLAVLTLTATLSAIRFGTRLHLPTLGLLLLSLPVMPSLQFFLGYPLRAFSGMLTAPLLQMAGFAVVRDAACLRWGTEVISIDAACSGVRMLWTGLFCAFAVASYLNLSLWRTVLAAAFAVLAIVAGNVVRASALFYLESGILPMPPWCHDAAGIAVFGAVAFLILWFGNTVKGGKPCAVRTSF